jgi:exopolysaccharide biosynthesis WecB/TagA/CpsF family protein
MPDGSPVARRLVASGYLDADRVAGPDFMDRMFQITSSKDITHYFYGSTEQTINKLRTELERKYPGIKIAGMYSPPFRELSEEEDREVVKTINDSGASLIWVGLGAPKQEKWMAAHKGKVNGVMFGVGAGFDFHAGTARRAPLLIQKLGLEWLYRLLSDPGRLFKRYFVTTTKFLWLTRKPAE